MLDARVNTTMHMFVLTPYVIIEYTIIQKISNVR